MRQLQGSWERGVVALSWLVWAVCLCVVLAGCGGSGTPDPVAPTITVQPQAAGNGTVAGGSVTFSVTASGDALGYQWQRSTDAGLNWAAVAGATAASYTLNGVTLAMNGHQFRVLVSNGAGSATSAAVTLAVSPPPDPVLITAQPVSATVAAGSDASFAVTATGTAPSYRWQSAPAGSSTFTDIPGGTGATLTLAAVAAGSNGLQLRVVVSNSVNSVTSTVAVLTVSGGPAPVAPAITSQPADLSVTTPAVATFTVAASGVPTPAIQWQVSTDGGSSFGDIAGATAASYSFATTVGDNGKRFRAVASNSGGSATSRVALLGVAPPVTPPPAPGQGVACARWGLLAAGRTIEVVTGSSSNATLRRTMVATVVGPADFHGTATTRVDVASSDNAGGGSSTVQLFVSWNSASGELTAYGSELDGTFSAGAVTIHSQLSSVFTPPFVDRTFTLDPGQSLTQTAIQVSSGTSTVNGVVQTVPPSTQTDTSTVTFNGFETLVTPAGSFASCKFTEVKGSNTTTRWVARDLGFDLKVVSSVGASTTTETALSVKVDGQAYP